MAQPQATPKDVPDPYAGMFDDPNPSPSAISSGTHLTAGLPPTLDSYFEGVDAVLSPEDRILVATLTPSQALYGILGESQPEMALGLVRGAGGRTVKEIRAFLQAALTALSVLDTGYTMPSFLPRDGIESVPRRVLAAVLMAKHTSTEVLVLPSRVVNFALSALSQFSTGRPVPSKDGLLFTVDGHGDVLVPIRAKTTDASNGALLSLISTLTRRIHVTVPLQVEKFFRFLLALAPLRLVSTPGKGSLFEPVANQRDVIEMRNTYFSKVFHKDGHLLVKMSNCVEDIRKRLNAMPVPAGTETNVLLQACWQLHRVGSTLADPVKEIARRFFLAFGECITSTEALLEERYQQLRRWPHERVAEPAIVQNEVITNLPLLALTQLYSARRLRAALGIDGICDHITQNNPFADRPLDVMVKVLACLKTQPYPASATSFAVYGVHKGHDRNLWPAGTEFYDLKPQAIEGIMVRQLDVNDTEALARTMDGKQVVFSDVCPELPGSIDIKKVHEQCSFAKNLTTIKNFCGAVMATPSIDWVGIKMFLAPDSIQEIPPFLVPLMNRFGGYTIIKSGKAHNDEYYIVFTKAAPKRPWGYWKYSMLRIAHLVKFGNTAAMSGVAVATDKIFATSEAFNAWVHVEPSMFPYAMAKGSGYKELSGEDFDQVVSSLFTDEDPPFRAPDSAQDAAAAVLLPPGQGKPDELVDRRPNASGRAYAATAALASASRSAGIEPGWSDLTPPKAAQPDPNA